MKYEVAYRVDDERKVLIEGGIEADMVSTHDGFVHLMNKNNQCVALYPSHGVLWLRASRMQENS